MNAPASTELLAPYPPLMPFDTGYLPVDGIHSIYYEQSGRKDGVPVIFLHGGPGAGSSPRHRQFFDPNHYRIIIFDQRGAGRSTPHAELRNNTTDLLIDDMEKLREKLGIGEWHVFGGSWGSTLALAYAVAHPQRTMSLTLRGIFLMMQREIDWFLYGIQTVFPDAWRDFASLLPENERADVLNNYYKLLTHKDLAVRTRAAQAWAAYESTCCTLLPRPNMVEDSKAPDHALPISRIEAHYFIHNKFSPEDYLLKNVDKIRHIPATIVQGRYDMVCPAQTAFELHAAWPQAELVIVPDAGHSAFEAGILSALIRATNKYRDIPARTAQLR
jgi:proline iminopeptidase